MICKLCDGELKELLRIKSLLVGQCQECAIIQLINPPKKFGGKTVYSEPEEHLDALARVICDLPMVSKVFGVSFKDESFLKRLKNKGFKTKNLFSNNLKVEKVTEEVSIRKAEALANKHGRADLVIARHILEHSRNPNLFLKSLSKLIKSNGFILLEGPDCSHSLRNLDYTTLWDEHIIYFSPVTFINFLQRNFVLYRFLKYGYPYEDSLIGIITPRNDFELKEELKVGEKFGSGLKDKELFWMGELKDYKKVGLFGAGHLSKSFIEYYRLYAFIDVVIDDDPKKVGKKFCGIPIKSSEELKKCDLVLLGVNPLHHKKIKEKHPNVKFRSIFPKKR